MSATRAAWFQFNLNGMDTTLAGQTATVQCGTCRTDWDYWRTRGGIRDSHDGAISVYATTEDHQQLKVHASGAAATFMTKMLNAAVGYLLDDMLPERLLRIGEISRPEGYLPWSSGWWPLLVSTVTGEERQGLTQEKGKRLP